MMMISSKSVALDEQERAVRLLTTAAAWKFNPPGLTSSWALYAELSKGLAAVQDVATAYASICFAIEAVNREASGESLKMLSQRLEGRARELERRLSSDGGSKVDGR